MGHRANFIILENDQPRIYYSHGRAQETPSILAQGLAFCEAYFLGFNEWSLLMDNAWAEGGILIDKDKKHLMIFGGADTSYTPALQRHYCKHLPTIWKGWTIEWCSKGNVDFAEYLGMMEDRILAEGCAPEFYEREIGSITMEPDRSQDDVTTIIYNGQIYDYKQDCGLDGINDCLAHGEKLKEIIPDALKIKEWHNEFETTDCLLVDYDNKKLFVCWGCDFDDRYIEEIGRIWIGWEVQRQKEGLPFHFTYTHRDPSIVEMTDKQFEDYCTAVNLLEFDPNE